MQKQHGKSDFELNNDIFCSSNEGYETMNIFNESERNVEMSDISKKKTQKFLSKKQNRS